MKKVLLFLSQGFEEMEAAGFVDVLGWSRCTVGVTPIETVVAGLHKEVRGTHSLVVKPRCLMKDVEPSEFAAIAIPGGFHDKGFTETYESEELMQAIKTIHGKGGVVASVCVGARPVAYSGILKDKAATSYDLDENSHFEFLKKYGAVVVNQTIAVSDNIITSRGPASAFDVALKLFELLNGPEELKLVKKAMRFTD